MRAVNLLPRDGADSRKLPGIPVLVGCGGTVLITLFLAVSFLSASSSVKANQAALTDAQSRLAVIPPPVAQSPLATTLPQQQNDRVGALASVLSQRVAFDRILREVSQVVPSDVWLQNLKASVPKAAAPGVVTTGNEAPTGFTLTGFTYSQEAVARFLARLDVIPDLTQVTLNTSATTTIAERDVYQFTISANVRLPGAATS